MKIEAGRYYRTRDGQKVGPMKRDTSNTPQTYWIADSALATQHMSAWYKDGRFWPEGDTRRNGTEHLDLVAEWRDEPDLTAITTPFVLLDEVYGPGTQEALKAHGGPYEYWVASSLEWREVLYGPSWCAGDVYRVKSAPPKPREFWLTIDSKGQRYFHTMPVRDDDHEVIHVREVLPDQP